MASARPDATANPAPGSRGQLKYYWTKGKGLARWATSPHPWTTLRQLLGEHLAGKKSPDVIDSITSSWYREVFGHMPTRSKKG